MILLPPLGLYIHIPWCIKKCPYCDFNSHFLKEKIPSKKYLEILLMDFKSQVNNLQGRKFSSVFFGGGTPSLFPVQELSYLLNYLFNHNFIDNEAEITIEVNPGAIEHGKFKDYKAIGINRVSLGVQSFQNKKLSSIGRIHSNVDIYKSISDLIKSSFDNFNIDLMHGLPGQTVEDACFDINAAIALNPTHLSWYQLTIEPNTEFFRYPPKLPNEDILFNIEKYGKKLLNSLGYEQYEISAYSKKSQYISKHNINYWKFGDYIGIGAGAHSKITFPQKNVITRYWNRKNPKLYMIESKFPYRHSEINLADRPYEFMSNSLRLVQGFSKKEFEKSTGLSIHNIQSQINHAINKGLLAQKLEKFIPTNLGHNFLNDLLQIFLIT